VLLLGLNLGGDRVVKVLNGVHEQRGELVEGPSLARISIEADPRMAISTAAERLTSSASACPSIRRSRGAQPLRPPRIAATARVVSAATKASHKRAKGASAIKVAVVFQVIGQASGVRRECLSRRWVTW
jgi:hypothetical protein